MTPDRRGVLHRPAPFERRQTRHLVEIGAAGVLAVLLFAVPAVLTRGGADGTARPRPAAAPGDSEPRVRVLTTELTPAVEAPALLPKAAAIARQERPVRARGSQGRRAPLARRLARLVAGDGRHSVQPFPTVPAAHR